MTRRSAAGSRRRQALKITHSGVIPCLRTTGGRQTILITNRHGKWVLPKGKIDPGMNARSAARTEAWEEAGLKGRLGRCVGSYNHPKTFGWVRVKLYLLHVKELCPHWPEQAVRRRECVSPKQALQLIEIAELRHLLQCVFRLKKHNH